MKYSKDRIRNIARNIVKNLENNKVVDFLVSRDILLSEIENVIEDYFKINIQAYEAALEEIKKKKKIMAGSIEWDITFNQIYEQELNKRLLK
ncbi:MAG: DUF507 family protein [Desulfurella sp.]|jgi:hypothetical protein|uniref:DUF507 family protein n=1 Tax=Desulfurella multipotens TaxID=79269 RepID=A0A1G6MNB4_9BACT|nr:hypothetical protein DESACE_03205 [Desulfurella acetivorans A63]PMP69367.1 MAG: DUF507 domain-containing protein [Desulfurella multipotens]PMP88869.1 MAG: DUF507 domain-containing protein [Desulfurella sp.]SDC57043.1 hypothetical protein SAMN05660835_01045 [Desulfurella multipotens]HEX14034.1 DUF507 family protein [Desulfurella acetivorans]